MNTQVTVGDLYTTYEFWKYVTPGGANFPAFISALNQVRERFINEGKWKGTMYEYIFDGSLGYITLPPHLLSVLGPNWDGVGIPVFSQWHRYVQTGPGFFNPNIPLSQLGFFGQLDDRGSDFCTIYDIPPPGGSIRLYPTGSDVGKVVRIYGIQQETGQPVPDPNGIPGEDLVLTLPFIQSAYHYSALTGAQKTQTNGPVNVFSLSETDASLTQLASWQPTETRPSYRRYDCGQTTQAIRVLAQLRYFPVTALTDFVIPGNLGALKYGLQALNVENGLDTASAAGLWTVGTKLLNDEARAYRGGNLQEFAIQPFGPQAGAIPYNT